MRILDEVIGLGGMKCEFVMFSDMVRQRKSYTVCEISYPDKGGHGVGYPILQSMIMACVHKAVQENCGEVGLARVMNDCKVVYLNGSTKIIIFSSLYGSQRFLEHSLEHIVTIGKDRPVKITRLHSPGTLRQAWKFLAKYQREQLLKRRQKSKNPTERSEIMKKVAELNKKLLEYSQKFAFD